MRLTYLIHILAGGLSLLAGFIALYAAKGATLHRRSGLFFVCSMLPMAVFGMAISAIRGVAPAINLPAGLMTTYLVVTALTTLRPPARGAGWVHAGAMLIPLGIGLVDLTFGFEAVANGGTRKGMPAFPFFLFGIVGVLATIGDLRVLRSGPLTGASRLARHLWRMSFALFIAALSFFIGQARVIPEPIRIPGLLALPVLAVLVTMFYWLWRVRIRRSLKGIRQAGTVPTASLSAPRP